MDTPRSDVSMWSGMPSNIPAPEFKTTRRGFDQQQVQEYIGQLNTRLQTVENLVRQLRTESEQAQQQRDTAIRERDVIVQQRNAALRERDTALQSRAPSEADAYEQVSDRVTALLVALDRDVEKMRSEAEAEAEQIVSRARSEAYRVRREAEDAHTAALEASKEARAEGERSLADLTLQRDDMLDELRDTCSRFLEVIGSLAASIEGAGREHKPAEAAVAAEPAVPVREDREDRTVVVPDVMPDRPA